MDSENEYLLIIITINRSRLPTAGHCNISPWDFQISVQQGDTSFMLPSSEKGYPVLGYHNLFVIHFLGRRPRSNSGLSYQHNKVVFCGDSFPPGTWIQACRCTRAIRRAPHTLARTAANCTDRLTCGCIWKSLGMLWKLIFVEFWCSRI